MFYADHILVFLIRLVSFLQIFSVFPLIFHTCRQWLFRFCHCDDLSGPKFSIFNITAFLVSLAIAIVYPKVGSLLGLVGGIIGFGQLYVIPIMLYLKREKIRISHPVALKYLETEARDKSFDDVRGDKER